MAVQGHDDVPGYGASFLDRGNLRAQKIAHGMIGEDGGRTRSRQVRRRAVHAPQPEMVKYHGSTGGSTVVRVSVGELLELRRSETFRVSEMSYVARALTRQHLTHRRKHYRRATRTASPASFAGEGADAASQSTRREKLLVKIEQRGRAVKRSVRRCTCSHYARNVEESWYVHRTVNSRDLGSVSIGWHIKRCGRMLTCPTCDVSMTT
jgi:hypothetical protein